MVVSVLFWLSLHEKNKLSMISLSGLLAGYEMAKYAKETGASIKITYFERDGRIGGRVKTVGR